MLIQLNLTIQDTNSVYTLYSDLDNYSYPISESLTYAQITNNYSLVVNDNTSIIKITSYGECINYFYFSINKLIQPTPTLTPTLTPTPTPTPAIPQSRYQVNCNSYCYNIYTGMTFITPINNGNQMVFGGTSCSTYGHPVFDIINTDGSLVDNSFTFDPAIYLGGGQIDWGTGTVSDAIELPTGKLLVCGNFEKFSRSPDFGDNNGYTSPNLMRFNDDYSVDTTYLASNIPPLRKLKIRPDGNIAAMTTGNSVLTINLSGTSIGGITTPDQLYDFDIQSNGKIVVATRKGVFRYNTNGTLDITFTNIFYSASKVIVQPDDKILSHGDNTLEPFDPSVTLRLNSNGGIDSTYLSTVAGSLIKLLLDGKVVCTSGTSIIIFNSDGTLYKNYFSIFTIPSNYSLLDVDLDINNDMYIVGRFPSVNGISPPAFIIKLVNDTFLHC